MATTLEGGRRQTGRNSRTATHTGTRPADSTLSQLPSYKHSLRKPLGPLITGEPALGYDHSIIHADTCSCAKCPERTMNPDVGTEV